MSPSSTINGGAPGAPVMVNVTVNVNIVEGTAPTKPTQTKEKPPTTAIPKKRNTEGMPGGSETIDWNADPPCLHHNTEVVKNNWAYQVICQDCKQLLLYKSVKAPGNMGMKKIRRAGLVRSPWSDENFREIWTLPGPANEISGP